MTEKSVVKKEVPVSERFVNMVMNEFSNGLPGLDASERVKNIVRGYFLAIDSSLHKNEKERIRKNENNRDHKYDNAIPYTWSKLSMDADTCRELVSAAKLGLDMTLPNMISPTIIKDPKNSGYQLMTIPGYKGRELIAKKYALNVPKSVIIQLVYKNDKFIPHFHDVNNPIDNYEFEISNPFDRGEIVGAFSYEIYEDTSLNKLSFLNKAQIDKRRPEKASAYFWGGTVNSYENGKKVEKEIDGWYEEMAYKTMAAYCYKRITIDPDKVDEDYRNVSNTDEKLLAADIAEHANKEPINITPAPQAIPEQTRVQTPVKETISLNQEPQAAPVEPKPQENPSADPLDIDF